MRARALPVMTSAPRAGEGVPAARSQYFHLVAVLQLVAQRHEPSVIAGADTGIADLAVHGIGKSTEVAPRGSWMSWPLGVKQNT